MLQRIRNCFGIKIEPLEGIVEVDETFIGGKMVGGQGGKGKSIVMGMLERVSGKVISQVVPNRKSITLTPHITQNISPNSDIMTDEFLSYKSLKEYYNHQFVNHSQKEWVRGNVHTNNLEGFWSILKRGITGIYHFITKKHIQKYVDEFSFRHNTIEYTENERFDYFWHCSFHSDRLYCL
jgi:transposase-like protein